MMFLVKNKTEIRQQIMFIDGTSKNVLPKETIKIDEFKLYKEEFERIGKFFEITRLSFSEIMEIQSSPSIINDIELDVIDDEEEQLDLDMYKEE